MPLTQSSTPRKREKVTYRLDHGMTSELEAEYTVVRVEVMGRFATREEARQYMIDTEDERRSRDA